LWGIFYGMLHMCSNQRLGDKVDDKSVIRVANEAKESSEAIFFCI